MKTEEVISIYILYNILIGVHCSKNFVYLFNINELYRLTNVCEVFMYFYFNVLFIILEANQCSKKKFKCDNDTNSFLNKNNQQSIGITDGKLITYLLYYYKIN